MKRRAYRERLIEKTSIQNEQENTDNSFLNEDLRIRLQSEIKYQIENGYLEPFLLVYDKNKNIYFLHSDTLKDLSNRELGFDLNNILDSRTLSFQKGTYNDLQFLDLIEVLIVFMKENERIKSIERLNRIFEECNEKFILYNGFIYIKGESGLKSIVPLVKDGLLKEKLTQSLDMLDDSYHVSAKVSADILQHLFSSEDGQLKTKIVSESLIEKIAERVTDDKNKKGLSEKLSQLVVIAKDLSNKLSDIRHTDKHTIPVDSPNIYKLIAKINLSIAEIAILTVPDEYVQENKIEKIKTNYLTMYSIDKNSGWVKKLDPDDIPF